jgi:hypothetical protein
MFCRNHLLSEMLAQQLHFENAQAAATENADLSCMLKFRLLLFTADSK